MSRQTIFSIALLALLIIPFGIRTIAPALEPYPAIMLPSGAGKLKLNEDEYSHKRLMIYGQSPESNRWIVINPVKFLAPMPVQFLSGIARNHFGLRETIREIWVYKVGIFKIRGPVIADEARTATRKWFQNKLLKLGFDSSGFKVVTERVTVNRRTGSVIRTEIMNEEYYLLN